MEKKVCRVCLGACKTTEEMIEIVHGEAALCTGCPEQPVMRAVREQMTSMRPRWWQVNGKLVVPIWIVDRVKNKSNTVI